jgi:hypothetical protein
MRSPAAVLVVAVVLAAAPAAARESASGACALITGEEVAGVQAAVVTDATAAEQIRDGLAISRCFYRAADYARSVHLELARRDASRADAPSPMIRWRELFPAAEPAAGQGEPRKSRRISPQGSQEPPAEKLAERQAVPGLGDEAWWVGTAVYGALYVRRDEAFLRLSLGGEGDLTAKLARARTLAERALARPW